MEFFDGDTAARIEEIRCVKRMTYERGARVAQLNVGKTKEHLLDQSHHAIDFIYDPLPETEEAKLPADPSHAYLSNVPMLREDDTPDHEAIGDHIADCIVESWSVVSDKPKRDN
jgi:hypothetical protein